MLNSAGYTATALETATEALDRLAEIRPDLRATAAWRHLPVLVSSGFPIDDIIALAEPDTEVLPKPYSDTTLIARVRSLIGEA